jgi:hypothetical protein
MADKPNQVERGGEVHADTPDKWSEDDKAKQKQGLPQSPSANRNDGKGHGELKGTDTPATTDAEYSEREKGKRTTM